VAQLKSEAIGTFEALAAGEYKTTAEAGAGGD
jgi:hypothetical protein